MATAFEALMDRYVDAMNRGGMEAVATLYAGDAIFFTSDGSVARGRNLIHGGLAKSVDQIKESVAGKPIRFDFEVMENELLGDTAYQIGTYAFTLSDGTIVHDGTYIGIGKKIGGDWKITRHMTTSHVPISARQKQMTGAD